MPVPITVAQVPLLGQHVAHRAWFRRRQFLLVQSGFDIREHLGFGSCRQDQLGFPDRAAGIARVYADKLAAVIKPLGDAPSEDLSPMTRDWSIYPQLEDWYRVAAESFIDAGLGQEAYAASTESLYYFYSRLQRRPDLQVLIYPLIDFTLTSPSIERLADIIDTKRSLRLEIIVVFLIAFEIAITFYEIYARKGY